MKNSPEKPAKKFQSRIEIEKVNSARTMSLLGSMLYLTFAVVDFFSLSAALAEVLFIRGMVIVSLLLGYTFTYSTLFLKYYKPTVISVYLLTAVGIELMILLSAPDDHASTVYFVGLILVIMTIFTWAYFELQVSILITASIICSYFYLELSQGMEILAILTNTLFLLGASAIGITSQLLRDRYIRENFVLHESLEEQIIEKTKEAETHEHLANHDQLTGLPNSRYAKDRLEKNLKRAKELDMSLVIMYLDLNGFKQVNDIYGHKAGDEVLRIVGKRLKSCVRNGDCAARLGGDEFAVGLLVEKTELGIAQDIREKIVKSICQPIGFEGNVLKIGTSVGMASYPSSGDKVSVLIEIADKRMYDAKQKMKKKALAESFEINEEDSEFTSEGKREPVVIFPGA